MPALASVDNSTKVHRTLYRVAVALAGLALTAAGLARATENSPPPSLEAAVVGAGDVGEAGQSEAVARVVDWIGASHDNGSLPFIVIDKSRAELFLFDAEGAQHGAAPVLIGISTGDDATPGVGGKALAEVGPAERTTPAGRFVARYRAAAGHTRVLWGDYQPHNLRMYQRPRGIL